MLSGLFQLILAITFVVLACAVIYKITLPMCLKIIDLCLESTKFRRGICIFLALVFCVIGMMQLKDFVEDTDHGLSRFFPLSFLSSGIFLFLAFWKRK